MTTTRTRERVGKRPKDVLQASFPTPILLNDFVHQREKFFKNTGIIVTMKGNSVVYFSSEDYRKVAFVNFEVLSSDLKKVIGHENVCWTTIQ